MEFVNMVIFPALATVLTGLITWGLAVLVGWINSKIKNEKVRAAVENAREIITAAVAATAQTFVDDLKKNGEFTPDKQAEAFKMTLAAIKNRLNTEAAAAINAITDDVEMWLAAEIEKAVRDSKKEA